ncbi:MAG: NAD(P)H-dependent flavin oxidoreductase [Geodermatophilaceae bacterium]
MTAHDANVMMPRGNALVTRLTDLLGLTLPLLQAGMGGVAGPELAAGVSNSGAGGILALYKERAESIRRLVRQTAAQCDRPFGINVIPEVSGHAAACEQVVAALEDLPESGFVTTFGLPDSDLGELVKSAQRHLVVQVGTPQDAAAALVLGADALVLQGCEAGGHHLGTTSSTELLTEVRSQHPLAVLVVAGGIATGVDLAAALTEGADGAMAGTLFIPARESRAHPDYKQRVLDAGDGDTVITEAFDIGWPHRPHRVLQNATTQARNREAAQFIATTDVEGRRLPVPRYSAAVPTARTEGRIDLMAMYCGTSCERVTRLAPAKDIVGRLRAEYDATLSPMRS